MGDKNLTLKKVPKNFNWPTGIPWEGYINPYRKDDTCPKCHDVDGHEDDANAFYPCGHFSQFGLLIKDKQHYESWTKEEPEKGSYYQLWRIENTALGYPTSPAFRNRLGLAEWCSGHIYYLDNKYASKEKWYIFLSK